MQSGMGRQDELNLGGNRLFSASALRDGESSRARKAPSPPAWLSRAPMLAWLVDTCERFALGVEWVGEIEV